jgi:hypothetical protein
LNGFKNKKKNLISVGVAAIFWGIWKTRKLACFGLLKSCIGYATELIGGQRFAGGREKTIGAQLGARLLEEAAGEVFQASRGWTEWKPRLRD